jgi:hypothetical protein
VVNHWKSQQAFLPVFRALCQNVMRNNKDQMLLAPKKREENKHFIVYL